MSRSTFQLVYDGPALDNHEMAARELAVALMAMDVLLSEADATVNSGKTETSLQVKASFKTGSFKIDFNSIQSFADKLKGLLIHDNTTATLNAFTIIGLVFGGASGLWALLKWLKGRKITRTEMIVGRVRVWVSDEYLDVERHAIELYRNHRLREALDQAVQPLDRDGIDSMAIIQEGEVLAEITKSERWFFAVTPYQEIPLEDKYRETHLHLISPSFQDGDKWRVNDGGSNFYVTMDDQTFIEQVLKGEYIFSARTILKVQLREVQYTDSKGNIKKECSVQKVLDVIRPDEQQQLSLG